MTRRKEYQVDTQPHVPFDPERITTELLSVCSTDRQRAVLARRYGLFGSKESLVRIASDLHCSKQNIWQVERTALDHLRLVAWRRLPMDLLDMYDAVEREFRETLGISYLPGQGQRALLAGSRHDWSQYEPALRQWLL